MDWYEPSEQAFANVLLYGPPKTGKTAAAASAPGRLLLINADLPNAVRYAWKKEEGRPKIPKMPGFQRGETPVSDLLGEAMRDTREDKWDTIVVDPLGELHRRLLEEASGRSIRPSMNVRLDVATNLERFCRFMCEAPVNFIIVAHEMSDTKGDEGLVFMPFTGSKSGSQSGLGPKIAGMVDIIGYTAVVQGGEDSDEPRFVAQLVAGKGRQGGDRFDSLGRVRDLDLTEWFETAGCHTGIEQQDTTTAKEAVAA